MTEQQLYFFSGLALAISVAAALLTLCSFKRCAFDPEMSLSVDMNPVRPKRAQAGDPTHYVLEAGQRSQGQGTSRP